MNPWQRQLHLLRQYNRALQEENRTRNQQKKLLQAQIKRLLDFTKEQPSKQSYGDLVRLESPKNIPIKENIFEGSVQYSKLSHQPINISSEIIYHANNSLRNQVQTIKSKYEAALCENQDLLCQLQNQRQEIQGIIQQQRNKFNIIEQHKNNQLHQLQNKIKLLEMELYQQQQIHVNNLRMEKDNSYRLEQEKFHLQRQLNQIREKHHQEINELMRQNQALKQYQISQANPNRKILSSKNYEIHNKISPSNRIPPQPYLMRSSNLDNIFVQLDQYKNDIDLYKKQVTDYDRRIQVLEQTNRNLQQQLKGNMNIGQKAGTRNQISKAKNTVYNQIQNYHNSPSITRNISSPFFSPNNINNNIFVKKKSDSHIKPSFNFNKKSKHEQQKALSMLNSYNLNNSKSRNDFIPTRIIQKDSKLKWEDLQYRISQIRNQNQNIKRSIQYKHI